MVGFTVDWDGLTPASQQAVIDAMGGGAALKPSVSFGALTLDGAGGVSVLLSGPGTGFSIDSGNVLGHWGISDDGVVTPTATGVAAGLPGPYSLGVLWAGGSGTVTVNITANAYHVKDGTEMHAALDAAEIADAGSTVYLRYNSGNKYIVRASFFGKQDSLTSSLTFRSDDVNNRALLDGWVFASSTVTGNVDLRELNFFVPRSASVAQIIQVANTSNSENIGIYDCEIYSDLGMPRDGGVWEAASWGTDLGLSPVTVENLVNNLTIDGCLIHNTGEGITVQGTNITVTNNEAYNVWADFLRIWTKPGTNTDGVLVEGNYFHDVIGDGALRHGDFVQFFTRANSDINNVTIRGNVSILGFEGVRQTPAGYSGGAPTEKTVDYTILQPGDDGKLIRGVTTSGNITFTLPSASAVGGSFSLYLQHWGTANDLIISPDGSDTIDSVAAGVTYSSFGRSALFSSDGVSNWAIQDLGPALQGIFGQGAGTCNGWLVEGNDISTTVGHGFTSESDMTNSLIRNNTFKRVWAGDVNGDGLTDIADGFPDNPVPRITVRGDDTVLVEYNVSEDVVVSSGACLIRNNYTSLSRTDKTTYSTPMQGIDFHPLDRITALEDSRIVPSGDLDVDNSGGPTLGDFGALGTTVDNGFYDFNSKALNPAFQKPVLTGVTATATASTAADLDWITDANNGTMYWVVTQSATVPSAAQIKAGQDHAGSAADASGSIFITSYGRVPTVGVAGLTGGVTYYAHSLHENAAQSDIASTASFIPDSEVAYSATSGDPNPADTPSSGNAWWMNREFTINNNATIEKIGFYYNEPVTFHVGIFHQDSTTQYDLVAVESFSHGGTGWEDKTLAIPYVVPSTGIYYAGIKTVSGHTDIRRVWDRVVKLNEAAITPTANIAGFIHDHNNVLAMRVSGTEPAP